MRVLRLREGEACVLFNGDGHDYDARLLSAGKRGVEAEVDAVRIVDNESPLRWYCCRASPVARKWI